MMKMVNYLQKVALAAWSLAVQAGATVLQALRAVRVAIAFATGFALSLNAGAVSPFDPLTTAVNFTDVTAAIFVVAAALMGVLVIIKGIRWIIKVLGAGR